MKPAGAAALAVLLTAGAPAAAEEPGRFDPRVQAPFDPALTALKPALEIAMTRAADAKPAEARAVLEQAMATAAAAHGADSPETVPYRALIIALGADPANDPARIDALFAITDRHPRSARLLAATVEMLMNMLNVVLTPDMLAARDRMIGFAAAATEAAEGEESAALADCQFRLGMNRTVWGMALDAGADRVAKLADGRRWIESAIAIAGRTLGENHPKTTEYMAGLADNQRKQGRLDEATAKAREVVRRRDEGGAAAPLRIDGLRDLADLLADARAYADAEAAQRRAIAIAETLRDPPQGQLLYLSSRHAELLAALGRRAEQEAALRRAVALAYDEFTRVEQIGQLAAFLEDAGRYEEALPHRKALYELAVAAGDYARRSGPIIKATIALASLYARIGRVNDAEQLIKARLDLDQIALAGPGGAPAYLNNRLELFSVLAHIMLQRKRFQEAETFARSALESIRLPDGRLIDETLAFGLNSLLAYAYAGQERYDEAEPLLRTELALSRRIGAPLDVATAEANLAGVLQRNGKEAEALALQESAVAGYRALLGADTSATLEQENDLAAQLAKAGRTDEAARLYARIESVIATRRLLADRRDAKRVAHAGFEIDRGAMSAALVLLRRAERDRAEDARTDRADRLFLGKVRAAWAMAH